MPCCFSVSNLIILSAEAQVVFRNIFVSRCTSGYRIIIPLNSIFELAILSFLRIRAYIVVLFRGWIILIYLQYRITCAVISIFFKTGRSRCLRYIHIFSDCIIQSRMVNFVLIRGSKRNGPFSPVLIILRICTSSPCSIGKFGFFHIEICIRRFSNSNNKFFSFFASNQRIPPVNQDKSISSVVII